MNSVNLFYKQYKLMVKRYINIVWNEFQKNPTKMLNSNICNSIATDVEFDSRIRQCAAKQACSMVNAVISKRNKRLYKLRQLQQEGKDTRYLQRTISIKKCSKPEVKNINIELDSRFINFRETNGHFNLFIKINQIGDKREILIPVKETKVSIKWNKLGTRKESIRINPKNICLFYEVEKQMNQGTKVVGADQGVLTCLSLSDGQVTKKDKHGHDLSSILDKISRRKKGSKSFKEATCHRKNYINWSINQLNFKDVKTVNLEKIFNIRKGKSGSRKLSHWTYTDIKNKLVSKSECEGFTLIEQDNLFRSQRCSLCGWVHKSNRKGKTFKCTNTDCNFIADSDLNAASNHEASLVEINKSSLVWQNHTNRTTGFYWLVNCLLDFDKEPIVPYTKKE